MIRLPSAAAIAVAMIVPATAATAPTLPAGATKLIGPQITAFYDGATLKFNNFSVGANGTVTLDLKKGTEVGTWATGTAKGKVAGAIRVKDDTFCYKPGKAKEVCVSVYTSGADIYETDAKGNVISQNQKQ